MDDDVEGVVSNIRAVITSSKGPVTVRSLMRDYQTLVGSQIPYQRLNYPTIENFLQSLPSLRVIGSGRDMMVQAAADKSSSHITNLISKQKSVKKKENYALPPRRGRPPPSQYRPSYSSNERPRGRGLPPRHSAPRFQNNNQREQVENSNHRSQHDYHRDEHEYHREKHDYHREEHDYRREEHDYRREEHDYRREDQSSRGKQYYRDERDRPSHYQLDQEHIIVKLEGNDRRQVSMGGNKSSSSYPKDTRPKPELAPRFQRNRSDQDPQQSPPIREVTKKKEKPQNLDHLNNVEIEQTNSIISPLGPGQLVAAGRAQQAIAQFEDFLCDPLPNTIKAQMSYPPVVEPEEFDLDIRLEELNIQRPLMIDTSLSSEVEPNLSPQLEHIPVPAPDCQDLPANVFLLLQYCSARKLCIPEYKVFPRTPKGEPKKYGARVKITSSNQIIKQSASYPFEGANESIAKGYAAKRALEEFLDEDKVKLDKKVISTDKTIISNRVIEIVANSCAGMFAKTVEEHYLNRFLESLPDDWIQTVTTCPTLSVESSLNNTIIVPKELTLEPVPSQQIVVPEQLNLETLSIGDQLPLYITHATSTCDIWCHIMGDAHRDKLVELISEMARYYSAEGAGESALDIQVGQYYAARSMDSWCRVCVFEVKHETKSVTAWLIDHGDTDDFGFSCLYRLPPEYCLLPRQALQIALEDLDSYVNDPTACEVVANSERLIGNTVIGQITHIDTNTDFIKMKLFDTNDHSVDVNINEDLLESIVFAKADPQLITEGCAMEVYISNITKKGEVFIQIPGVACDRIGEVLNSLSDEEISKHKLTSYRQVVTNKIYLAKYSKDENWYRAVVTAAPSMQQNKIAVRFIDFGNAETVSITDIAEVENLPSIISKLPAQALKVAMHNLPVETLTNTEIAKLHSMLLDEEKTFLIKTVNLQEDPPVVEIFYKKDDDSALVSVNNTIVVQRLIKPIEKKNSHDGLGINRGLQRPDLSGEFLAVLIVLAANPGNFNFQLLKYERELESLMRRMQTYYQATALPEVRIEEVVKGGLFAAVNNNEVWFRVVVTESVIGSKVPVRFCDFGEMECLPVSNLRDLEEEFHTLPFMAMKGKLEGVVPIHTDWSVDDCVRFQNLVMNKPLASIVVDIEENFQNVMETVVSLHLVDKQENGEEEVIKDILIKENRAVKKV